MASADFLFDRFTSCTLATTPWEKMRDWLLGKKAASIRSNTMRSTKLTTLATFESVSPLLPRPAWLALATLCWVLSLTNLGHAGFVTGNYKVDIGESERLMEAMLQHDRDEISEAEMLTIQMQEMCKNPSIRLIDRNRPAILLQNTTDPNGPGANNELSQFTIDLEQLGFEFGNGDFNPDIFDNNLTFLSNRSDGGISISSSYGTVSDTDPTLDPAKLILDIQGLTPGAAVIFRVDLDPTSPNALVYSDYREVILGADVGGGSGNPALISATFAAGTGDNRMTTSSPFVPFGADMGPISSAGLLEGYHAQSSSEMFSQSGGTEIPEPSTSLLLCAGLALASRHRCRR